MLDERCYTAWCGLCYENRRGRQYHKGHRWASLLRPKEGHSMATYVQRVTGAPGSAASGDPVLLAGGLLESAPALMEYLTLTAWDDAKPRKTATLLLFVEEGQWKGCLNDRDAGRSLWVTGGSVEGVVATLEARLASGGGEWRRSYGKGPPKKG